MALNAHADVGYAFGPVVRLRVRGAALARRHFEREYGPGAALDGFPDVDAEIRFGRPPPGGEGDLHVVDGHKTARWRVDLSDPRERPLRVGIAISGGPASFALSLVQGYYVEPLVAVALAHAGSVALPSAAVAGSAGALVIIGRSGSGKSSVSVRALARGRSILGDDQVVISGDGGCWPYPRRLRLYPDIRDTAPEAWSRLRRSTRRTLRLRQALRWSTRGYVAPSLAVPSAELSAPVAREWVPAARVAIVERSAAVQSLTEEDRDAGWAAQEAGKVLAEQRVRLSTAADARWTAALDDAAEREAEILRGWLERLPIAHLRIPRAWDAPTAVRALAERLGTDLRV